MKKAAAAPAPPPKPPPIVPGPKPALPGPHHKRIDDGFVQIYGYKVPKGAPKIAVELQAYRENRGPELGGYGAEEHFRRAFRLMWPKYEWSDWVEMLIQAWCNYKYISVIGHQRASKTFTMAHIAYLDYCADPEATITSLATVTFDGLRLRMWADLLHAIETAQVKFPLMVRSSTNEMRVYPNVEGRKDLDKFQIHGIAINGNKDAEGRIRGAHAPRRRFFGDEAEDIAEVIYDAMTNITSGPDGKAVLLTNPKRKLGAFGNWCEPVDGWQSVSENDLFWLTKKGGICLHFDGLQSPNVKAGKTIFTGLLTNETIEDIRKVDTENSVAWWSRVRGWFPPDGLISKIFPDSVIIKAGPSIVFDFPPVACASFDPAFEMDKAPVHFGEMGRLRSGRQAINCVSTEYIRYVVGKDVEPKDYQAAHQIMAMCSSRNVKPANFIMDKSGGGRGVFAILQKEWSMDIQGIEYGGPATDRVLRPDESEKCCDLYKFFVTELWFRAYNCCLDSLLGGLDNLPKVTKEDLNAREYEVKQATQGELRQAEPKHEFRSRMGRSPDEADAFCQFGELLARLGSWPGSKGHSLTTASSMWNKARERARQASLVYAEKTNYKSY